MSTSVAQLLQTGMEHHRSGRLQEAESCYQSVREQRPDHPDAWHLLGVIALQTGKVEQAAKLVEKAIEINPDTPDFYITCAEAHRISGKHEKAIDSLRQAIGRRPGFVGAHVNLGNVFMDMGQLSEAEEQLREAIKLQPNFALAHNNLGVILKDTGREEEAIGCFQSAINMMPGNFEAHNNLGNTLYKLRRIDDSIREYERAISLKPDYAEAHNNLGNALKALDRLTDALSQYDKALAINPRFAMAHCNLGTTLDELGRYDQAVKQYNQALALQPDYAEAHNNLANALDKLGLQDAAISHYMQAVTVQPDYAEAYRNLSRLRPEGVPRADVERLLENQSLPEADVVHCHFALGNKFHAEGSFEQAYEHFSAGNALKRSSVSYCSNDFSALVDRLISTYSKDFFESMSGFGSDSESLVFVLGMPRSGTSLVEQIVASHPDVYGAGELSLLPRVEAAVADRFSASGPYPESVCNIDEKGVREFSAMYLDGVRKWSLGVSRVTDKLPSNFLRVGLIKTLFPRASIIHCNRNAMDTCTSNFLHCFDYGNEYSFDLVELGHYYLDYQRLMRHWGATFSSGLLTVNYEELVHDQERVSRKLIDHIGLQWNDACLDFHKSKRAVNTFSSGQVRQPVYTHAMNRWKRYEKQLAPLSSILEGL